MAASSDPFKRKNRRTLRFSALFWPFTKLDRWLSFRGLVSFMNSMLAVMGLSGGELILLVVVILVLFGARKIPEFAKGLGQGIKEFKKASRETPDKKS